MGLSNPSVAVVIAVKDGESTIGATLGSLAAQDRGPDQVVVVDDGSHDATMRVVDAWRSRLPITVLHNDRNRGLGASRRSGMEIAETDLLTILDADDIALPDHLSALLTLHLRHGGIATAQGIKWLPRQALARRRWIELHPLPAPGKQLERLVVANFVFIASLFSSADYHRAGGFRDLRPEGEGCEDWDLWLRMVERGSVVRSAPEPTVLYRLRSDSLSAGDRTLDGEMHVLRRFLDEHDLAPDVRAAGEIGVRHRLARHSLRKAYALASAGRYWSARRAAAPALRGSPFLATRAVALVLAPSRVNQARRRLLASPQSIVDR